MPQNSLRKTQSDNEPLSVDERYGLRQQVIGGHVVSMVTGRSLFVFSPPDTPKTRNHDELEGTEAAIDAALRNAAVVRLEAAQNLGDDMLDIADVQLVIPDDVSSLSQDFTPV